MSGQGVQDWFDLMPAEVLVASFVSRDSYGAPTYGQPNTYRARVVFKTRLLRANTSEQAVARGTCWLGTVDPVTTQDKITLPDGSNPLILQVDQIPDEAGPHHTVLFFA